MTSQMIIRIPDELKTKVSQLARAEGKNMSSVVRELMEDYVRDRDMSSYVDDLWNRIGDSLKTKGISAKDIRQAIRQERAAK